jgi:phospholipid transport system substrate-binding protein
MLKRLVICLGVLFAIASPVSAPRAASSGPEETVRGFYATLLQTMQNGAQLGEKGRYDALAPAIRDDFDLASMTHMAVGTAWSRLSPPQQQAVTEAFARYTTATYANRFDSWSGERFDVAGTQSSSYGTIVQSRIVKSNGEPVDINYLMHRNGDKWQVTDVYLTGTVSQVATLRSQFAAVLARDGVDGLIATLNRKAEMLVANAGRS